LYHYVSLCIISRLITFPTRSRSPHCSPHSATGHLGGAQHSLAAQKVRQISEGHGGLQWALSRYSMWRIVFYVFFTCKLRNAKFVFSKWKSSHAPRPACLGLLGPFTVSLTANSATKSQHVTDTFLDPVSRWRRWNICSRISWCRSNMVQLCVPSKCSVKSVATYCKIADPVSIDWFGGAQIQTYSGKSGIYGL
jgi:hypothetical protein